MTEPPIHALYFLTRYDSQGVEKYCRVCHNHLKQPYRIGETLHHQGTIPVNLWGWFSHVTRFFWWTPYCQNSGGMFFPKNLSPPGLSFDRTCFRVPQLAANETAATVTARAPSLDNCETVKLMRQHPGATFHRIKWELEKNFMEFLIPEISRIMPCFQVVQISLRGSTGLIWIKFQDPNVQNQWQMVELTPPRHQTFHKTREECGTTRQNDISTELLAQPTTWVINDDERFTLPLECLTRSFSGWVFPLGSIQTRCMRWVPALSISSIRIR